MDWQPTPGETGYRSPSVDADFAQIDGPYAGCGIVGRFALLLLVFVAVAVVLEIAK